MENRVKELESQVKVLTQVVDSLQTKLKDQQGQLNMKVDANKVISAINMSDEGVRIIGKQIRLDGGTMVNADFKVSEYKPVRANNLYIEPKGEGKVWVLKTSRLDRIESKIDKLLDLMQDKELVGILERTSQRYCKF